MSKRRTNRLDKLPEKRWWDNKPAKRVRSHIYDTVSMDPGNIIVGSPIDNSHIIDDDVPEVPTTITITPGATFTTVICWPLQITIDDKSKAKLDKIRDGNSYEETIRKLIDNEYDRIAPKITEVKPSIRKLDLED